MKTINIDTVTTGGVLEGLIGECTPVLDSDKNIKRDEKGNPIYTLPAFKCQVYCGKVRDIDKAKDDEIEASFRAIIKDANTTDKKRVIVRFIDKQIITDSMNNQRGAFTRGETITTKLKKAASTSDTFKKELEELLTKHISA